MSRSVGVELPPGLVALLSQRDLPSLLGRAIPLVTVDERGRPHPMLASYLEMRAAGSGIIRVVLGASSRTAANLEARRVTGSAIRRGALARFDLAVEDVLEDTPAAWETGLGITSGISYAPAPALDQPPARDVLALLDLPGVPG